MTEKTKASRITALICDSCNRVVSKCDYCKKDFVDNGIILCDIDFHYHVGCSGWM